MINEKTAVEQRDRKGLAYLVGAVLLTCFSVVPLLVVTARLTWIAMSQGIDEARLHIAYNAGPSPTAAIDPDTRSITIDPSVAEQAMTEFWWTMTALGVGSLACIYLWVGYFRQRRHP